jgi:hypothetical protein
MTVARVPALAERSSHNLALVLRRVRRQQPSSIIALAGWAGLIATAVIWGHHLLPGGSLNVHAPPFQGQYRFSPRALVPGTLFAMVAIVVLPTLARRLPWRLLLGFSVAAAAGWAVSLAVWDGHRSLASPISRPHEYLPAVSAIGNDPAGFLGHFADDVASRRLPVHVNGHPPLMVLVLWAWDRLGAGGPGWAAALVIGVGSSAVAAVAVVVRAVGDEPAARRALPFLILGPFAITVATSADGFFLGVGAWTAAALAVGWRSGSWRLFSVAGLLAGALPYLSYGLLPYGLVLLAVGWLSLRRHGWPWNSPVHRAGLVGAFIAGLAVVPVLISAGGFWWLDGVAATHHAWQLGRGDDRPYLYSFVADFAVLAVLVGPATAVAATSRRLGIVSAVLATAALVSLFVLALTGVTRLEVERIWLPFVPWLVVVTSAFPQRARGWLLVNALCALVFQAVVIDVW